MTTEEKQPRRLMAVSAHADDMEFSSAGTIAKWTREGWEAAIVICTDGRAGTADPDMDLDELAATREREAKAAAEVLGIKEVIFLRYRDGELDDTRELREKIVREIRRNHDAGSMAYHPYRAEQRAAGRPRIDVAEAGDRSLHLNAELLTEEQVDVVEARVRDVLSESGPVRR